MNSKPASHEENGTLLTAGRASANPDVPNVGAAEQIYSREFGSIFYKINAGIRERIERKLDEMGTRLDQFPHHRLEGSDDFRLRVGDYRIIYQFDLERNSIYLITLGHRREIYR